MSSDYLVNSLYVAAEESYKSGDVIFAEGTSGDWIYVVISGQVEIFKMVRGRKIVVDILQKGDLFGEVSFVDKKPRSAGARALEDVNLGVFDRSFLTQEYNKIPSDFRAIFDALARRLRKMTGVATNLAGRKTDRAVQTIQINFRTEQDFFKAYSSNIGGGGLFVHTEKLLKTGAQVNLEFNLPGDTRPIHTQGVVSRAGREPETGMGIQFTNMKSQDTARIAAFVRKHEE